MTTVRRWPRPLALLLVAALVAGLPLTASAQEPPRIEVVAATQTPDGLITVSLSRTADGLDPLSFTALLDGIPVDVRAVDESRPDPTSVAIVVDTSGSMEGAPMASARSAALALVERLDPADPVAVIGFSSQPVVLSNFTTDRAATRGVIEGLVASGETALFDAVKLGAEVLASAPTQGARAMVLLSDGEDSGASASSPDEGLGLVTANDIDVYAFALGDQTDVAYLQQLATASYWEVANEEALSGLFEALGNRLGATISVEIAAPPLPLGEHTLELRGSLAGQPVAASTTMNITNEGLLKAEVTAAEADRLIISVQTAVPVGLVTVRGVIDGVTIEPTRDGDLFFDNWALTPGAHDAEITAYIGGEVAARHTIPVEISVLEPQVSVALDPLATPPVFNASARVQGGGESTTIRLRSDGEVVAEGPAGEGLSVPAEGLDRVTAELVDAQGAVLAEAVEQGAAEGAGGGGSSWLTILLGLGALGAAGGAAYLYWRQRRASVARPVARPIRARPIRRPVTPVSNRETLGQLKLRTPEGDERTVPIGLKPLTVGSSADCDVVLDSETIRPVHARVSARPNGEFQVHGVGASSATPYLNDRHDEWAVLTSGESIAIGDHVITLLTEAETEDVGHAIFRD